MKNFDTTLLQEIYIPPSDSHKGQNGKMLLIGGSHLFHSSTLWALEIASKIVDMVFYASVPENNEIVNENKKVFRNGIVIRQDAIEDYIEEADAILIGPGMNRSELIPSHPKEEVSDLSHILALTDEGEKTYYVTKYLLTKYPHKKWIIDAGALQMMDLKDIDQVGSNAVITPHHKEFEQVFHLEPTSENVKKMTKLHRCIILLKGETDIICSINNCMQITGGNAGMTKGGTGDVLAGLVTALATKNDLFLSACAASYINKKAGESLYKTVGLYFNSSDLVNEIPKVMKEIGV